MTLKKHFCRFRIHDEVTPPEPNPPPLTPVHAAPPARCGRSPPAGPCRAAGAAGPKSLGFRPAAPAALRGYPRLRTELRSSKLPRATRERIGLAVAEWRNDPYTLTQYARTA